MDRTEKDARAEESGAGREESEERSEHTAHGGNVVAFEAFRVPLYDDMACLIRAALPLIPLHIWDAVDAKGCPRGKTPRHSKWQKREYDSAAVLAEATANGWNVGVRLPPDWLVVDVDPRNFGGKDDPQNKKGRDPLAELVARCGLDLSIYPHVVTGSGGHHYYLRKPVDVEVLDSLEDYPGIEFKSRGRQVVAPGSIHPNGTRYEWDDFAPPPHEAPKAPESLLKLIRRPARVWSTETAAGELTQELLAETLEQLDAEDFRDHDEWLKLMMACHHATAGDAREEFIEWSTSDPEYADHRHIIGPRWDSLHLKPTGGRQGRPITIKYLHKVVQEHGGQVARVAPEDDFEVWEGDEDPGLGVDDAALRAPPKLTGLAAVIEEMNCRHYVIMDNGFRVVTEEPDPIFDGRVRYLRHSKSDFRSMYENQLVETADKPKTKADLWLKSPKRRQYNGIIFDPSGDHEGWMNMWKGWAVQPSPGSWDLLDSLIREVLTDGNAESYEYVLDWIAFMFQHPEKVAEVAIAFRGAKGTGKSTLGRTLFKAAGAHGLHIGAQSQLVGRFNSHLQDCVCLFADEAFWAGDKAGEAVLKQLVTEPTLTYEGKGRDVVTGRNHVHIIMASNNDWMVPAGMDGERRFAVFNVNEKRRGDRVFFEALNEQLERGGLAGFLHDMLARDIDDWHPRDDVPQTEALLEQIEMSQSAEESWWDGLLESARLPSMEFKDTRWGEHPVEMDKDAMHSDYAAHAQQMRQRPRDKKGLAMKIKKRAGIGERQVIRADGTRVWRWVLPPLEEAREIWARSKGAR